MGALRSSPFAQNRGKVMDVLGHQDAVFLGRKREDILVCETLQRRLLVKRPHIVPVVFQPAPDRRPRDVRVE